MKDFNLYRETFVQQPLEKVFDFFSKAENLELLTPNWLQFKILSPLPIAMAKGTLIDYQIRLLGVPMKWKTLIKEWNAPYSFVDSQLKGPYTKWEHLHQFKEENGGTTIIDRVEKKIIKAHFLKNNSEMCMHRGLCFVYRPFRTDSEWL